MPIDTKHPDYVENYEIWEKCEDFYSGEEAVKNAGTKYVPKLSGQTQAKYNAYIKRAPFFGSVSRTVSALAGAVFRKPASYKLDKSIEYLRKDATGSGMSLTELAITLTVEVLKTGRVGLLVDIDTEGGLPYLTVYDADDVINWDENEEPFVVLEESKFVRDEKDKFKLTAELNYRELSLDSEGQYNVTIWKPINNIQKTFNPEQTIQPIRRGRPMDHIPFCVISPTGLDFSVDRPPILDMVNALAAWWRVSVDHANAIHTICVPTPVVAANIDKDDFVLTLGPDTCIILPESSKAEFLEFKAGGLKEVSSQLERLMDMQAALGARLITNTGNKTLIETAEGARIRESMSTAVLGSVIASVEAALMKALDWAADWVSASYIPSEVILNKELVSSTIDANMVTALLKALIADRISFETFYRSLEEAGLTDPGVSVEDEKARIKKMVEEKSDALAADPALADTDPSTIPLDNTQII